MTDRLQMADRRRSVDSSQTASRQTKFINTFELCWNILKNGSAANYTEKILFEK